MDFKLEIKKTNVGIRISIFEILFVSILGKIGNFDFFGPNLPQNGYLGWNFENLSLGAESAPPRYHVCQFSGKTDNFDFFNPNLPGKGFWGLSFKILSLDSESAPPIYHECQFSGKTDSFEFFSL